ncbi:MAG TPA: HAD hydrolase-like protein [Phenylobacterium sp.]|jgi:phosphoglycolate phosphatase|uniref:HAD hydrolase-like protein n=1 Tax=Phenylobacterium sp. TaxID=1871053 RepID=UPI002C90631F|nr:HAD hydrolase-like protein [Phenylobacterium sp.]HXA38675.1 HAD hydrolase-like protein [Phenylobacterium sp.]
MGADRAGGQSKTAALSGAVIAFDLDGTLVDTVHDLVGTLNWLLATEGLAALSLDAARPFIGRGARWLIERGFQAADAPLEPGQVQPLLDRFLVRYEAHIADESRPFPGCIAALEALRAKDAKLVVCTNKLTRLSAALLDALDMSRLFDAVIGSDRAPAIKPDARHLLTAIAEVGGDPARAVLVGDAGTDAGAARAAKVPLILVSFGYTETPARDLAPDILIDHFDELPNACVRLLGACEP